MMYEEIRLHPTFLSFMLEADAESTLSENEQAQAASSYLKESVASFIKEGRLHLWFEEGASVERLGVVIGSGLAALIPESERGSPNSYGAIAARTAVFLHRLEKSGRL